MMQAAEKLNVRFSSGERKKYTGLPLYKAFNDYVETHFLFLSPVQKRVSQIRTSLQNVAIGHTHFHCTRESEWHFSNLISPNWLNVLHTL